MGCYDAASYKYAKEKPADGLDGCVCITWVLVWNLICTGTGTAVWP